MLRTGRKHIPAGTSWPFLLPSFLLSIKTFTFILQGKKNGKHEQTDNSYEKKAINIIINIIV